MASKQFQHAGNNGISPRLYSFRFDSIRFYRCRSPMAIHYVNGANGLANIVPATKTRGHSNNTRI